MYPNEILSAEMEKQGFTNEKLAVKANLASRTVSSLRNGEENVRLSSLKKAAGALKLKVVISFEPARTIEVTQT